MPTRKAVAVPAPRRRHANAKAAQRAPRPAKRPAGVSEAILDRRQKAIALRTGGASYREIATQLGCDVATAWDDVQTVLETTTHEIESSAGTLRALECRRLDMFTLSLVSKVQAGDVKAVQALVQVSTRRARLLGLDAPIDVRQQIDVSRLNEDELEQFIVLMQKVTGGVTLSGR